MKSAIELARVSTMPWILNELSFFRLTAAVLLTYIFMNSSLQERNV